MKLKQVRAHPF